MKVFVRLIFAVILLIPSLAYAVSQESFTLTVLHENKPIREFSKQVIVPFHDEYKLRLKNNHNRRCSAEVFIDGAPVSSIGNFIINSNGILDLERFLTDSLTEGKRFKFVPLSDPNVDDPNREENGLIEVVFTLEKEYQPIKHYYSYSDNGNVLIMGTDVNVSSGILNSNPLVFANGEMGTSLTSTLCSSAGATVPGSASNQTFYKVDFEPGEKAVTLCLRMVGIDK